KEQSPMKKSKNLGSTATTRTSGTEDDDKILIFRIHDPKLGKRWELDMDDVGAAHNMVCRQRTGFPVDTFVERISVDSIPIVIWMAEQPSGNQSYDFSDALKAYGTRKQCRHLDIEIDTGDDDETDVRYENEDNESDPLDDTPSESGSPSSPSTE